MLCGLSVFIRDDKNNMVNTRQWGQSRDTPRHHQWNAHTTIMHASGRTCTTPSHFTTKALFTSSEHRHDQAVHSPQCILRTASSEWVRHTHSPPPSSGWADVFNHSESVLFCPLLSDCVRASARTKSIDPDVVHRSVRLDQPTATPVPRLTPRGSHSCSSARHQSELRSWVLFVKLIAAQEDLYCCLL